MSGSQPQGLPMCQVVEAGLGHLPFAEHSVVTPTGHPYVGVDFAKKLCGVSTIRSGEAMENALRACCKGIKIGKLLLHRRAPVSARCMPCAHNQGRHTSHSSCGCACCKGITIGEAAAAPKRASWLDRPSARAVRALLFFLLFFLC